MYSEGTLKQSEFGINDLRKFLLKAFLECYFDTRVLLKRDLNLYSYFFYEMIYPKVGDKKINFYGKIHQRSSKRMF